MAGTHALRTTRRAHDVSLLNTPLVLAGACHPAHGVPFSCLTTLWQSSTSAQLEASQMSMDADITISPVRYEELDTNKLPNSQPCYYHKQAPVCLSLSLSPGLHAVHDANCGPGRQCLRVSMVTIIQQMMYTSNCLCWTAHASALLVSNGCCAKCVPAHDQPLPANT